eukprot:4696932-Amphidinium_carterae.1
MLERDEAENDIARVRDAIRVQFPSTVDWKQHWRTPERRPSINSDEESSCGSQHTPHTVSTNRCLLCGDELTIANPDELQRRIARHREEDSPRVMHQP